MHISWNRRFDPKTFADDASRRSVGVLNPAEQRASIAIKRNVERQLAIRSQCSLEVQFRKIAQEARHICSSARSYGCLDGTGHGWPGPVGVTPENSGITAGERRGTRFGKRHGAIG